MDDHITNKFISDVYSRYGTVSYLVTDGPIGDSFKNYGEWAQKEIEVILEFIRSGDTVIDVGANIGAHTLAFSNKVGLQGKVISFEPQAELFKLLSRNVVQNNAADHVTLFNNGLDFENSTISIPKLNISQRSNYAGISLEKFVENSHNKDKESTSVKLIKLDDLNLEKVNLIKIDVEGMENRVIAGAVSTITRHKPNLFVEASDLQNCFEYLKLLKQKEYIFFYVATPAYNPKNFKQNSDNMFGVAHESNVLCLHSTNDYALKKARNLNNLFEFDSLDQFCRLMFVTPRSGDLSEEDRDANKLQIRIRAMQDEISRLTEEYAELIRKTATAVEALERNKILNSENRKLISKIQEYEERIQSIEELKNSNQELKSNYERLVSDCNRLESERSSQVNKVVSLERSVDAIIKSKSWRITAPMRKFFEAFR